MTGFEFHFMRPLWLLSLLPLALLLWRMQRSNGDADAWRAVVDVHLLPGQLTDSAGDARRRPLLLLGLGWLLIVLALAGPAWERLPEPLYQARQFRVVVLDLSPSMNASDLAPSRLARARYEVLDLLRQSDEGQTALLAFGAEPYLVSPLTSDVETIAAQVPSLDTSLLPVSGARRTDLALDEAGKLLQQGGAEDGEVILVSDDPGPAAAAKEAAQRLRAAGYRVSVLGLGTADGAPVRLPDGGYLKDAAGAIRMPKLDVEGLRALAESGGGVYVSAEFSDRDIEALRPRDRKTADGQTGEQLAEADRWREEGPWLLLALLPLAAFAFRRGWLSPLLLLVCLMPPSEVYAFSWEAQWLRPDQQAKRLLEEGRPDEAAQIFQRPDWRAAAQYQANDFEQALQSLHNLDGPDADYNRGNTLARLGRLEEAVEAYDRRLDVEPGDADARHNRQLVQRLIEERRQQQQADQQNQQDQQQKESEDREQEGQQDGERQAQQPQAGGQGAEDEQPDAQQADTQGSTGDQQKEPKSAGQESQNGERGERQASAQGTADGRHAEDASQDSQQSDDQDSGDEQQPMQTVDGQDSQSARQGPQGAQGAQGAQEGAGEQMAGEEHDQAQPTDPQDAEGGQQDSLSVKGQASEDGAQEKETGNTGPTQQGRQPDGPLSTGQSAGSESAGKRAPDPTASEPGLADLLGDKSGGAADRHVADATAGMDLEDRQAVEQMLRRVEDDPAGLLRQRFLLQHLRRSGQLP